MQKHKQKYQSDGNKMPQQSIDLLMHANRKISCMEQESNAKIAEQTEYTATITIPTTSPGVPRDAVNQKPSIFILKNFDQSHWSVSLGEMVSPG